MTTIEATPSRESLLRVQVVKFDIPFLQLVWLLIKLAIAAIPAAIIFGLVMAVIGAMLGFFFGGLFNPSRWI